MIVKELIEKLKEYDENKKVEIVNNEIKIQGRYKNNSYIIEEYDYIII